MTRKARDDSRESIDAERAGETLVKIAQFEKAPMRRAAVCYISLRRRENTDRPLPLLDDPDPDVRKDALAGLRRATRQEFGYDREAWKKWFEDKEVEPR